MTRRLVRFRRLIDYRFYAPEVPLVHNQTMSVRNFMFTWNNPPDDAWEQLCQLADLDSSLTWSDQKLPEDCPFVFLIWQQELGSLKTRHLQGYAELSKKTRFTTICSWINGWHVEKRKGSQGQAIAYCTKTDTRVVGPWDLGKPRKQGARNDLELARQVLLLGKRAGALFDSEETFATGVKYHKGLSAASAHFAKQRSRAFRTVAVNVLVGEAGIGKSRYVLYDSQGKPRPVFTLSKDADQLWFDGYDGETEILLDDFYGWIKYSYLLRILDGHQVRIPKKGGHDWAEWTTVWITSNKDPDEWYQTGMTEALDRRISGTYNDVADYPERVNFEEVPSSP